MGTLFRCCLTNQHCNNVPFLPEAVSLKLLKKYPDQIDGLNRLAMVYEARGEKGKAAEHYRKAHSFAMSHEGFDQGAAGWFLSEANRLESQK